MIEEIGQIVEVGSDYVKVTSRAKSGCGSCAAERNCGQSLLARWGAKPTVLTLAIDADRALAYKPHDSVLIGIPDHMLARGALLLYLIPIIFLLCGVLLGSWLFAGDLGVALLAVTGLCLGAILAKFCVKIFSVSSAITPVLIGKANE